MTRAICRSAGERHCVRLGEGEIDEIGTLSTKKLDDASPPPGQPLGEAFFNSLAAASSWGAQFANRIVVTCP